MRERLDFPKGDGDALRREIWRSLLTAFPDRVERQNYMCQLINELDEMIGDNEEL